MQINRMTVESVRDTILARKFLTLNFINVYYLRPLGKCKKWHSIKMQKAITVDVLS